MPDILPLPAPEVIGWTGMLCSFVFVLGGLWVLVQTLKNE